jgi:uncharacterized membrane protein YphA (DoxX/SURF4 family)
MTKAYIIIAIRLTLACIFLVSGVSKLFNIQSFISVIQAFGFFSGSIVNVIAIIFIIAELVSGFLLLIGLWTKFSSAVVIGLLILFIAAIIPNIAMGNDLECGCFGPLSEDKVDSMLLVRDIGLLSLALIIYKQDEH